MITALSNRLERRDCVVLTSDALVETPAREAGFYPDVSVFCRPGADLGDAALTDPVLVVEVLSPSTRNFDLGDKFVQ